MDKKPTRMPLVFRRKVQAQQADNKAASTKGSKIFQRDVAQVQRSSNPSIATAKGLATAAQQVQLKPTQQSQQKPSAPSSKPQPKQHGQAPTSGSRPLPATPENKPVLGPEPELTAEEARRAATTPLPEISVGKLYAEINPVSELITSEENQFITRLLFPNKFKEKVSIATSILNRDRNDVLKTGKGKLHESVMRQLAEIKEQQVAKGGQPAESEFVLIKPKDLAKIMKEVLMDTKNHFAEGPRERLEKFTEEQIQSVIDNLIAANKDRENASLSEDTKTFLKECSRL